MIIDGLGNGWTTRAHVCSHRARSHWVLHLRMDDPEREWGCYITSPGLACRREGI
jgi:hypothetical protein